MIIKVNQLLVTSLVSESESMY